MIISKARRVSNIQHDHDDDWIDSVGKTSDSFTCLYQYQFFSIFLEGVRVYDAPNHNLCYDARMIIKVTKIKGFVTMTMMRQLRYRKW